jgi:hypothetical protein
MASVISVESACVMEKEEEKEKEKEKEEETCSVCMDSTLKKNQCVRPCGHMMCAPCDAAWKSRGKIQEFKMQRTDKRGKENIMVYMTVSNCPSCRRKDEPHDYRGRSKVSMFHEIQFLTRTLYLSGIRMPMTYASQFNEMDEAAVTVPPPVRRPDIFTPPPVMRRVMDVFSPYVPAPVAPVASAASVPASAPTSGTCCRRRQGVCHTTRTKLRCGVCNRFLCRSCRGSGCVCQSP